MGLSPKCTPRDGQGHGLDAGTLGLLSAYK